MSAMTKVICHNGHCEPTPKKNEEDHFKMASVESFIKILVIISIITAIVAAVGGFLVEIFTL